MSEFKASGFSDEFGSSGPNIVGLTTFTSPYYFVPPSGSTAERPSSPPPGMLRFNTDIGRLEVWRNDHWATILGESPNLGTNTIVSDAIRGGTGTRGLTGGAYNDGALNTINYITIPTLGNAQDFGDVLTATTSTGQGCASRTRGIFAGGLTPGRNNVIQFVTISSTGDAQNFGDLTGITDRPSGCSNSTRGLFVVGGTHPGPATNVINYITISSTGDAQDFGDVSVTMTYNEGTATANSVRGVFHLGFVTPGAAVNTLEYVTISTTGNAQDFGDTTLTKSSATAMANSTRGIIGGFYQGGKTIDFFTIATTGNTQDFGDSIASNRFMRATMASPTRGIFAGGRPTNSSMEYITIPTTGNGIDFGDLTEAMAYHAGFSNGHGGL